MSQVKNGLKAAAAHSAAVATDVAEKIGSAVDSVGGGVRDAARRVKETAGHAAAAVEEQYKEVGQTARASFERGRTQARHWENRVESAVRRRPFITILIAAAVGLLAGLLWQCRGPRD